MTALATIEDPQNGAYCLDEFNYHERLYRAVLAQLLRDARSFKHGVHLRVHREAFEDVRDVGPMLRHVCKQLDIAPLMVSDSFLIYCGIDLDSSDDLMTG